MNAVFGYGRVFTLMSRCIALTIKSLTGNPPLDIMEAKAR